MLKATNMPTLIAPSITQVRAVPERGRADELADQAHAFVGERGQGVGLERGADVGSELVVPLARELRLQRAGLDGLDASDGFHQQRLVLGAAGELLVEALAQDRHDEQAQTDVQRQAGQHDEGERHAVGEHHRDEDHREQQVEDERERLAGEKAADVLQLAHTRHRVADAPRLEVGQRQGQQVTEQLGAEFDIDAAGGVGKDVAAQRVEHALEHDDDEQADDQHVEGGHAAMDKNLIHNSLEEERRDEREQLQEQAHHERLAEQAAVLD
jgi:hypothetical protein